MATEYPQSTVIGSDYHAESVAVARKRAAEEGLDGRVRFEVASAQTFTGGPFDLVTTFDALHDMGDPLGAARHVLQRLADDGTWMIVEPFAGATVGDNLDLTAAGASLATLVKTTIFYADVNDFAEVNAIYARHMPDPPPARSAPANVNLPRNLLISIDAIAALPAG